ncbi:hypothetical protein F5Y16DRAFT_414223 [Xylariaceae sp. FL0255]|nr:hypothetical protein F5Y16DRAFT_414223 [Xylariaceae sp. FL0255]
MQTRTRKERRFDETEQDLPNFAGKLTPITSTLSLRDKFHAALSYLGKKNPLPRALTASDTVWLLDNTAYRNPVTGQWEAEYVAAMFSQLQSNKIYDAVGAVARKLGLDHDDPALRTAERRIRPFVLDIKPGSQVDVKRQGSSIVNLGPSGPNGISAEIKSLMANGSRLSCAVAQVPKGADGLLEMKTFFAEPEGWGLISDIDDTIKVTQTSDPTGILQTTFIDQPQPTPDLPDVYQYIHSLIGETSAWFYLSASPYNLYPFLRKFRDNHYPHGTIILRDSSWMSVQGLLTTLTLGTQAYKVGQMDKINGWLPRRKMICVGDSTQTDPESYGEIYRKYPGWIKVILIRKVEDIAALGIEDKNKPERFEKAFEGVPRDVWHVFGESEAESCKQIVQDAKSNKDVPYELIYWPSLPGRGEFVRLALEEGGAEYTDTAHMEKGVEQVLGQIDSSNIGDQLNPPPLAPPILRHGDLLISQTSNILLYLGPRLGLVPPSSGSEEDGTEADPDAMYRVNALALTALDGLCNEAHDTHHPVASGLYYEDQKDEALRKASDYVSVRLPKFLGYFERVLQGKASGAGPWLYGGQLTYADLVLFQCMDGLKHAFRKAMSRMEMEGKYVLVFKLYDAVKQRPRIQEYLMSERRQEYGMGIYRYYEELDLEDEKVPEPTSEKATVGTVTA